MDSEAPRPPRPSLFARKRTYDASVYEGENSTATSSDPALFSGDEQDSVGAEDYAGKRKKKMYAGSWWSHQIKAGKEDRKKEFKRNFDSGIFMGSDSEPPSSDSFTSLDDELVRDQARADPIPARGQSLTRVAAFLEAPDYATPLARRTGQEAEADLDTTPRKRVIIRRNEDHIDQADISPNQSTQLHEALRIIHQCLEDGQENVDLSGCALSELPSQIGELAHLTKQTNLVMGMLESGASLETHLRLFLGNNFLRQLPLSLLSLTNLRELSLRRNKLTSLPAGIRDLVNLEKLNVSGNKLSHLPFEVINLVAHHRLREVTTEPNLWETTNEDQVDHGRYRVHQLRLEPRQGNSYETMLSAFNARPIVELKQRDKSKIESILSHSDQLFVGLNTGSLRIYRINAPSSPSTAKDDGTATKPSEVLREIERFSKNKIEQLAIFREANIIISLSNNVVSIHDLVTYELQEQLVRTKGATLFAVTSNIVKDTQSGVLTLVSKLAVAVKRRILLWTWHDGELDAAVAEIALASSIKCLAWATERKLVAGLNTHYELVDVESQEIKTIVGPGNIGGTPGQDSSRLGGTMSYIGMGSMVPPPLATALGENEMLLAKDVNSHFIDHDGEALGRRQVPWTVAPTTIGYSYPFLLSLSDPVKGTLEVRNPETVTLLQAIEMPGAVRLQVPNPNISLAHQGKGFLVASERTVWQMQGTQYDSQIDTLVADGNFDEAVSLLKLIEETLIDNKAGRLREIKMLKAQQLFNGKKFRDSLELFSEVSAPPERVIRLYPELIAGALAQESPSDAEAEGQHPIVVPIQSHKRAGSTMSSSSKATTETDAAKSRNGQQKGRGNALAEKELILAVRELQAFLADCRRQLQQFFNPDQTVKSLDKVQELSQSEDIKQVIEHLLGISNLEDIDYATKITATARLVDTTLFRAHMYATPALAGSLFRISNFCDPDVVMNKLEESKRYNDLIDFLYGKRLHRQALERLEKFGQSKDDEDVDTQLRGPERLVRYLQALPHELVDLILEFARWPLEKDSNLGMEVFLAETENAELLDRHKVLSFLESVDKALAQRYLEHVIDEWDDQSPELHQKLLSLYLDRLKEKGSGEHQVILDKFMAFLKSSSQYLPAKILRALPVDEPDFFEARAILFGNMGNYKQALEIYIFKLDNLNKAEEYCNQLYLESVRDANKTAASDPVDKEPSIYHTLLNLYLHPPKGEKALLGPALELMAKHGSRLPASSTLEMVPPQLLVRELEFYFRGRMRNANTIMNESKIVAGLRKVDAVRMQAALLLGERSANGGRSRHVRIDEERVCSVCHKRLGGSVISVFPDNSVVHLGCAKRRQSVMNAS
ncbi:hypothetical protein DV735_g2349, partial [Chaetothyriales sp. CBS 134920]